VTRVCLVTGAAGPLGTALIERCAGRYDVVAVEHRRPVFAAAQDRRFVDPLDPARELPAAPVHVVRADLSDEAAVAALAAEATERFGGVDLLVNAAAHRRFGPLVELGAGPGAARAFDVNVLAPLRVALALVRACWSDPAVNVERNRGIVNVSSTAGMYVYPDLGQGLYAASKAALNHLTYHLAAELWDLGVRANAVAPDTFPGRVATSAVVEAILDLDASRVTGEVRAVT
jgi:NAD(P)-dependent dehydrogenase (short-subunit alcohol dehydrogenase family)